MRPNRRFSEHLYGVGLPSWSNGLIQALDHPLISTTVGRLVDGAQTYTNNPDEIIRMFGKSIDVFLDGGPLYGEPSSVIDLTGDEPVILRKGQGDLTWLGGD